MVTLVALVILLPVRSAIRAVAEAFDFKVRFCVFTFSDADVKAMVPYTSSALPNVALLPLLKVRLFKERVAADVCVKFNEEPVPVITIFEADEPVMVPLPVILAAVKVTPGSTITVPPAFITSAANC